MKRILIWVGASIGLFVVLVGITFAVLSANSPDEEILIVEYGATSKDVESKALKVKQAEVDTLQVQLLDTKSQIFFNKGEIDSLTEQLSFKDGLISGYKKEIEKLNGKLLKNETQTVSMKELAKTYESMKANEMKAILANVNDKVVIDIYKNMSAKTRKTLFQALDQKRAAEITETLAGRGKAN